jgi:hypothetical protein
VSLDVAWYVAAFAFAAGIIPVLICARSVQKAGTILQAKAMSLPPDERRIAYRRFAIRHGLILAAINAAPITVLFVVLALSIPRLASAAPALLLMLLAVVVVFAFAVTFNYSSTLQREAASGKLQR